jgi:hypothetical protein
MENLPAVALREGWVVSHQHPGMNLPPTTPADFTQPAQKNISIIIFFENGFTPIATSHDVVASTWILEANRSGHAPVLHHREERES